MVSHRYYKPIFGNDFFRCICQKQLFFVECFMDELAELMNKDALDFRRELLQNTPRALAILDRLETLSNWGNNGPESNLERTDQRVI